MDMGNYQETLYLWELVANCLDYEPWSEEETGQGPRARATPSSSGTASSWKRKNNLLFNLKNCTGLANLKGCQAFFS